MTSFVPFQNTPSELLHEKEGRRISFLPDLAAWRRTAGKIIPRNSRTKPSVTAAVAEG